MPTAAPKACTTCGKATDGGPRCTEHSTAFEREHGYTQRQRNPGQGSAHQRGYGAAWRKKRAAGLKREPLCRTCKAKGILTPATIRDHITPKKLGGTDDERNLQSLCKPCHDAKTASESSKARTHG